MNKFLPTVLSLLFVSQNVLAENIDYNKTFPEINEQISNFDSRHSLMPLEIKPIQKNNILEQKQNISDSNKSEDNLTLDKKTENMLLTENSENFNENKNVEQKIIVKEEIKPVYLVPNTFSNENKTAETNSKDTETIKETIPNDEPKLNKEISIINTEKQNPVNNLDSFELKQVPEKKYDGNDIILSNIIDEKADNVETHPLIIHRPKEKEDISKPTETFDTSTSLNLKKDNTKNIVKENVIPNTFTMPSNDIKAHIASYMTIESASKGIDIWKEKYPLITILKTSVNYEKVGDKGMFYRVYVIGDEAKLENLCNQMKSNKDWCNIIR